MARGSHLATALRAVTYRACVDDMKAATVDGIEAAIVAELGISWSVTAVCLDQAFRHGVSD